MSPGTEQQTRDAQLAADAVAWHDLECGDYHADLELWHELAAAASGPVLEIGAGSGRVALELARAGHEVVALDNDPILLDALARRAGGLALQTICADAREFALEARVGLILVPMQTIQLLHGAGDRARFFQRARVHLRSGGVLAAALLPDSFEQFDAATGAAPDAERMTRAGVRYRSQPTVLRIEPDAIVIERVRERRARGAEPTVTADTIRLDRVSAAALAAEALAAGFSPQSTRQVPATAEHVGSAVVIVRV